MSTAPLRCCLLSGGGSRRMGTDKALLPHPEGGTWLERSLRLLLSLERPVCLLSRHRAHRLLAPAPVEVIDEPPPWDGPLTALARLMDRYPGDHLLLCPVDMPWLDRPTLEALIAAGTEVSGTEPGGTEAGGTAVPAGTLLTAHDGRRDQPLLGIYPATAANRAALRLYLAAGDRRLLGWLQRRGHRPVPLPAAPLRNCNRPAAWPGPWLVTSQGIPPG